jgi:hypothetical protein
MTQDYPIISCVEPIASYWPAIGIRGRGLNNLQRCSREALTRFIPLSENKLPVKIEQGERERESKSGCPCRQRAVSGQVQDILRVSCSESLSHTVFNPTKVISISSTNNCTSKGITRPAIAEARIVQLGQHFPSDRNPGSSFFHPRRGLYKRKKPTWTLEDSFMSACILLRLLAWQACVAVNLHISQLGLAPPHSQPSPPLHKVSCTPRQPHHGNAWGGRRVPTILGGRNRCQILSVY